MNDALAAVATAFSSSLASEPLESGELLTLPIALSNGHLVQIYAERTHDDRWFLSDQGQAAFELSLAGVNLETQKVAARSWDLLLRSLRLETPVLTHAGQYDLTGIASHGQLGTAVLQLAEAVVRAEGLAALAPSYKSRRFRDVIVRAAGRRELAIQVDAAMPTKHGGRRSVSVAVEADRTFYMQAISGANSAIEGFDKAQAVFSSADVPREQLVAVLAAKVRLEPWQWSTLQDSGQPVHEGELERFMDGLAA